MEQVKANTLSTITLGRQGENLARQIVFDVSGWETEYGLGVVELIAQRPGEVQPYPVAVHRNGTIVTWDVSSTDTEMPGDSGKCELRYYVGEVLAKSKTKPKKNCQASLDSRNLNCCVNITTSATMTTNTQL